MRRTAIAFLVLALAVTAASPALATQFWLETFSYSDGGLFAVSGGNWATHSGTGTDIQVVGQQCVVDMTQFPDDNRTFPAIGANGKVYACMHLMIPGSGFSAAANGNYFAHFKDTGTSNFDARLAVGPPLAGGNFALGIGASSSTFSWWSTDLAFDTWYNVVIDYNTPAGTASLWVNASDESNAHLDVTGGSTTHNLSAFAFRQSNTATIFKAIVDDLGVGTTFDDACNGSVLSVRETSWGMLKTLYR